MIGIDTIDRYTMKARVFPAAIALAPALALVIAYISWDSFTLSDAFVAIASVAFLAVLADVSRRHGKCVEGRLLKKWGGLPSVHMLRHRDTTLDYESKRRYLNFLADKIGGDVPTVEHEESNPILCDAFYTRCCLWLREHTRDKERFGVLFDENTNYGFRRNLLGMKKIALILNFSAALVVMSSLFSGIPIDPTTAMALLVVGCAGIHAAFFMIYVNETAVNEASRLYARQLILSCEALIE
jgi:hypothetical protein